MKVLLIDNYDSFTYNLVHYLEKLQVEVTVIRNDKELPSLKLYDGLVLSPGPGLPKESGQLMSILNEAFGKIPILGICLGMQALAEHCGAILYNRKEVMHGRTVQLKNIKPSVLLKNLKSRTVGLYHSWAVVTQSLDKNWCICAIAMDDCAPMVIENSQKMAYAVQFHPESILTTDGFKVIDNWVKTIA